MRGKLLASLTLLMLLVGCRVQAESSYTVSMPVVLKQEIRTIPELPEYPFCAGSPENWLGAIFQEQWQEMLREVANIESLNCIYLVVYMADGGDDSTVDPFVGEGPSANIKSGYMFRLQEFVSYANNLGLSVFVFLSEGENRHLFTDVEWRFWVDEVVRFLDDYAVWFVACEECNYPFPDALTNSEINHMVCVLNDAADSPVGYHNSGIELIYELQEGCADFIAMQWPYLDFEDKLNDFQELGISIPIHYLEPRSLHLGDFNTCSWRTRTKSYGGGYAIYDAPTDQTRNTFEDFDICN